MTSLCQVDNILEGNYGCQNSTRVIQCLSTMNSLLDTNILSKAQICFTPSVKHFNFDMNFFIASTTFNILS